MFRRIVVLVDFSARVSIASRSLATRGVIVAALGCDGSRGADEGPHCRDEAREVAADEVTPLGFAPRAILDLMAQPYQGFLTWADGPTTDVAIAYEPDGGVWFVDSEVVPGTGDTQPAIAPICDDRVEVGAAVSFSTADGAFAEAWTDVRIAAAAGDRAGWIVQLDLAALGGSFDLVPFVDAKDYDQLEAWVDAGITGTGASSGRVEGQASGEEDCASDEPCAAWAESVEVATWGESA